MSKRLWVGEAMAIEDVVRKYVHENDSVVAIHGAGNNNVVMVVVVGMVVGGMVVVGMVVGRVVVGMVADGGRENDPGKETTMGAHATPPHPPPPPPPTTTTRLQRDQRGCCN